MVALYNSEVLAHTGRLRKASLTELPGRGGMLRAYSSGGLSSVAEVSVTHVLSPGPVRFRLQFGEVCVHLLEESAPVAVVKRSSQRIIDKSLAGAFWHGHRWARLEKTRAILAKLQTKTDQPWRQHVRDGC